MLDNSKIMRLFSRVSPLTCLLLASMAISGCTKSFVVTSEVPRPLIERLPVVVAMKYSEEFRSFEYVEKSQSRALEKVDFGAAQVGMFDQVFGSLFTLAEPATEAVDLIIEPQILDFQYSVPAETKLKLYEIWLKYRLRITDANDKEIADWVVKGYGKTPTSMLSSQLKAFNTASNVALRDIGAQLAIGFQSQPSIEDYLGEIKSGKTAKVVTKGEPITALGRDDEITNAVPIANNLATPAESEAASTNNPVMEEKKAAATIENDEESE
jgi:hypothetical protein